MFSTRETDLNNYALLCVYTLDSIFIVLMCAASLKVWYERHIKVFLTTWNQLRVSLATNGKYKHIQHTLLRKRWPVQSHDLT